MNIADITFGQMVKALAKGGANIQTSLTPDKCELLHHAIGVAGEYIELQLAILNQDASNFMEEAGDLLFYVQGACEVTLLPNVTERIPQLKKGYLRERGAFGAHVESFVDTIKRHIFYEKPLNFNKLDIAICGILNELDAYMRDEYGKTLLDAIKGNMTKLAKRYEGFRV